jgi:ribosomal protein L11 methyltransferase
MLVWRKLASAKWEDAWVERLAFLGPMRVSITALPGSKTVRIEAWDVSRREAALLVREFGGTTRTVNRKAAFAKPAPRPPVRIRDRMLVVSTPAERRKWARQFPDRIIIEIPPATAFGTGEHATTASCLRLLCDLAAEFSGKPWQMLDLGTGSGILAIAARELGAQSALACDYDAEAVRVTRENLLRNGVGRVTVKKFDVTAWTPERTWPVIAANLFSEVLIKAAPAICAALAPGGALIISGVLRAQERECLAAFEKRGLRAKTIVRRGKWVAALFRRAIPDAVIS